MTCWEFTTDFNIDLALSLAQVSKAIYHHEHLDIETHLAESFNFEEAFFMQKKISDGNNFWRNLLNIRNKSGNVVDLQAALCRRGNTVFIVFQGSKEKEDWLTNLTVGRKTLPYSNILAHRGFVNATEAFIDAVNSTLNSSTDQRLKDLISLAFHQPLSDLNYVITGHSLGGAIATLTGAYLHSQGIDRKSVV